MAREFAIPRSCWPTSIGSRVVLVVSPNVSVTPNRNSAARTAAMSTRRIRIEAVSSSKIATRTRPVVMTMARRSSRSATTPAYRPNSSQGSRCKNTAIATTSGLRVCDATSSGPAARVIPSPRLVSHDEASSQRKLRPRRDGAMSSANWCTTTARPRRSQRHRIPGTGAGCGLRPGQRQAKLAAMTSSIDSNPEDEYADDEYADHDAEDRAQPSTPAGIPDEEPEADVLEQRQEVPYREDDW